MGRTDLYECGVRSKVSMMPAHTAGENNGGTWRLTGTKDSTSGMIRDVRVMPLVFFFFV